MRRAKCKAPCTAVWTIGRDGGYGVSGMSFVFHRHGIERRGAVVFLSKPDGGADACLEKRTAMDRAARASVDAPVRRITAEVLRDVDAGVRELVAWLNEHDFFTVDSGDGESKPADEHVLDVPHVFCVIVRDEMLTEEARRLASLLREEGVRLTAGDGAYVEASYNPVDDRGVIGLFGVNDAVLRGAREQR